MADDDLLIEKYQDFLDFDWNEPSWKTYLDGLYPAPTGRQLTKFKKKWYRKNVDAEFDDTFEPYSRQQAEAEDGGSSSSSSHGAGAPAASGRAPSPPAVPSGAFADGSRWQVMRQKATICLCAYGVSLVMALGAFSFVFSAYQALVALMLSFVLELLAKYGLKLTGAYMQNILFDEVGVLPIMAITMLMPGLHPYLRTFCILPFFLSAVLSFAQICKNHPTLSATRHGARFAEFFAPLANSVARYRLMEWRAHLEVLVGFLLVASIFLGWSAPLSSVLYWNFMMMRYMMSSWTQNTFKKIDNSVSPVLGKLPGIKLLWPAFKRWLFGFVDPESRRAGKLCTIL